MENSTQGSRTLAAGVGHSGLHEQTQHYAERGHETETGLTERAQQTVTEATELVKEHPYMTIAMAAGLAFAIGALWKMRSHERRSQIERWTDHYMPRSRSSLWGRGSWSGNHWGNGSWGRGSGWGSSFWR